MNVILRAKADQNRERSGEGGGERDRRQKNSYIHVKKNLKSAWEEKVIKYWVIMLNG